MTTKRFNLPKIGRDTVLFAGGLAGIFHETVISETERSALLVLFGTMVGLPAFLRSDEKKAVEEVPPSVPIAPKQEVPPG